MSTPALGGAALVMLCGLACAPSVGAEPGSSSVTLEWTSPGDDGAIGNANHYDIRYSLAPITAANFGLATPATDSPKPAKPGKKERVKVKGLGPNQRYYFALKTVDDNGNWSGLSNVVAQTPAGGEPAVDYALSMAARPTPARTFTTVWLSLPKEMRVRLLVIDASGRVARTLFDETRPAGETHTDWNLQDNYGRRLAPGNYWLTARLAGHQAVQRIIILP